MDPRICKSNYYNGTCRTKSCTKYHLRRSNQEDTIIIDTYTNYHQHMIGRNSNKVLATFPPGIKLHVLNVTNCPHTWSSPPKRQATGIEIQNIVGFDCQHYKLLADKPEIIDDIILTFQSLINNKLYTAISVELGRYAPETPETPGSILLSNVLTQYSKKTIPQATPLFIKAHDHSTSLHKLMGTTRSNQYTNYLV